MRRAGTASWRRIVAAVGDVVCPASCGGCGSNSVTWLCPLCATAWWEHRYRAEDRLGSSANGVPIWSFAPYRHPWKRVLGRYKDGDRRDLIPLLALTLACAIEETLGFGGDGTPLVIVPVPSTAARTRQRGDWPWGLVCTGAGHTLATPGGYTCTVLPALHSAKGSGDQDALSGRDRWTNRRGGFVAHPPPVHLSTCVVVDDVTTTGASLTAAVDALHAAGWLVSDCVTIARVR